MVKKMAQAKIQRPTDPYSPDWPDYWAANPHMRRSVGADATSTDDDTGGGDDQPDIEQLKRDAAEAAKLRDENALWQKKHQEAEKHKKEQERLARENAEKAAKTAGDFEAYERSVNEKITGITSELTAERDTYRQIAERRTAGAAARDLASRMAIVADGVSTAEALLPHIASRIGSKIVDGDMIPVVLDANGRETAMTIDDLEKELRKLPYLKHSIAASSASGGGRPGGEGNGKGLKTRDEVRALNPYEKAEYFKKSGGKYAD